MISERSIKVNMIRMPMEDSGHCMQVYRFNVPTFGKDVVFDVHHKVRAEQFKFFSEALKIAKMTDYVPLFVQEAEVSNSACPRTQQHPLMGPFA